jgi:hypothetical protein
MTEFFFPDNKCGIGKKVERPVFKFIADCDIPATPKPIFDCPLPIVPREPEIPCPEFNVKSKLEVGFSSTPDKKVNNCDVSNKLKFEIKKRESNECPATSNECQFDIDLEVGIAIPIPPCPVIRITEFTVKSGYSDQPCSDGENSFKIRRLVIPGDNCLDPGSCEFEVDLSLVVPIPRTPCPVINIKTFEITSEYANLCESKENKFEITTRHNILNACDEPDECIFDVDLSIVVPVPVPLCPQISVANFTVNTALTDAAGNLPADCRPPKNRFEIRRIFVPPVCGEDGSATCEFEIDLEISTFIPTPACPEIGVKSFSVISGFAGGGGGANCFEDAKNKFTITKTTTTPLTCVTPETCAYDIELEIVVPIPAQDCPTITIKKFEVKSNWTKCLQGRNKFEITRKSRRPGTNSCSDPGECNFEVELEINVPIPEPPCPDIRVKSFSVISQYLACVPRFSKACAGTNKFTITKRAKTVDCDDDKLKTPECDFDVELEIVIPPPLIPCPVITIKKFEIKTDYEKCLTNNGSSLIPPNEFKVTRRIIPCTCTSPEQCEFDFELTINVPIPEPPCPEIDVKSFSVSTLYPVCIAPVGVCAPPSTLKITRTKTPPPCQLGEPECKFDVELDIVIPQPKIPCPELKITKFEVKSDYEKCLLSAGSSLPPNKFAITKRIIPCTCDEMERCEFDIELTLTVPIPEPPCPEMKISNFNVKYINYPATASPPNLSGCNVFKITKKTKSACDPTSNTKQPSCEFDFDLSLCVPVPTFQCPRFTTTILKVDAKFDDCVLGSNKLVIKRKAGSPPAACEFDVELEINVPIPKPRCPIFGTNLAVNTHLAGCGTPSALFVVLDDVVSGGCNESDACLFEFDLRLDIPLPKFVSDVVFTQAPPKINVSWCVPGPVKASAANLKFTPKQNLWGGACDRGHLVWYEAGLELDIVLPAPPCNIIVLKEKPGNIPIKRVPVGQEHAKIIITPKPRSAQCGQCEFEFSLDIQLECICRVELKNKDGKITQAECVSSGSAPAGRIWLDITQTKFCRATGSDCVDQFTITPNIILPPAKFKCPEFYSSGNAKVHYLPSQTDDPYAELKFNKRQSSDPCAPCDYDVYLDVYIAKSCVPKFTYNGSKSSYLPYYYSTEQELDTAVQGIDPTAHQVFIEEVKDCEYEVSVYSKPPIYKPKLVCADFKAKTGGNPTIGFTASPSDPPTATLDITAQPLGPDATACTYDVTLEIKIPKPCVPKFNFNSGLSDYNPYAYTTRQEYFTARQQTTPDTAVTVSIVETANCEYDVYVYTKLPVYVPNLVCSTFTQKTGSPSVTYGGGAPSATIAIVAKAITDTSEACDYDVTLDIKLCKPEFYYNSAGASVKPVPYSCPNEYASAVAGLAQALAITVKPVADTDCLYDITLSGNLPVFKPKTLTFNKGTQKVNFTKASSGSAATGTISVAIKSTSDCSIFLVDAVVDIALPPITEPICTGKVSVNNGSLGSGTLTCNGDKSAYNIAINLSTTACPTTSKMMAMPFSGAAVESTPAEEPFIQPATYAAENLWQNTQFVDGFIAELSTNDRLRNVIKSLLAE